MERPWDQHLWEEGRKEQECRKEAGVRRLSWVGEGKEVARERSWAVRQAGQQSQSALMVSPGWAELLRPLHSCIKEDSLNMGSFGRGVIWALPPPETPQDSQYLRNNSWREGVLGTHYNLGDQAKLLSEEELGLKARVRSSKPSSHNFSKLPSTKKIVSRMHLTALRLQHTLTLSLTSGGFLFLGHLRICAKGIYWGWDSDLGYLPVQLQVLLKFSERQKERERDHTYLSSASPKSSLLALLSSQHALKHLYYLHFYLSSYCHKICKSVLWSPFKSQDLALSKNNLV